MKRVAFVSVAVMLVMIAFLVGTAEATAAPKTCKDLLAGTTNINVPKHNATFSITAPAGTVFDQVCVKAGSTKQGNGPQLFQGCGGLTTCVISHTSGKDISHYSYTTKVPPTDPPPTEPPPYCRPYNVGTWYECNTGNSTWSAPSASKCWCQGLTGRVHYHTTYDCGNSYVTEGNWDDAPDWLGHYKGGVCPIGGC